MSISRLPAVLLSATLLAVPAAAHAAPRPNPNGTYVGTETPEEPNGLDDVIINFKVKGTPAKRKLTDFTIAMNVVCSGYPIYVQYVVQPMHDMRVNPRTGKFHDVVAGTSDGGTGYAVVVTGRLQGTKVKNGTLAYDVGICQRGDEDDPIAWVASRTKR